MLGSGLAEPGAALQVVQPEQKGGGQFYAGLGGEGRRCAALRDRQHQPKLGAAQCAPGARLAGIRKLSNARGWPASLLVCTAAAPAAASAWHAACNHIQWAEMMEQQQSMCKHVSA
jgi:hypothetical protein